MSVFEAVLPLSRYYLVEISRDWKQGAYIQALAGICLGMITFIPDLLVFTPVNAVIGLAKKT